jgi:EmrB/QacA subfamily drug resistance transporter
MGVFTVGSALCGAAPGITFLSISRAFQGLGGAIMFATSLAMLSGAFKGRERGIAFGVYGGVTGLAIAIGPVLGGALVSGLGWRWIFYVNIPIGVIVFVATLFKVDESRDPVRHGLDLPGFFTFSLGLAALVFGLIRSNSEGWGSLQVAGSLVSAFVLLAAFVIIELRRREPMFDLKLTRVPTFDGAAVAAFALSASAFSLLTYIGLYFQDFLGMSALSAGVRFLPLSLSLFVAAAMAGRLTSVVEKRFLVAPGFVIVAIGLFLMRGLAVDSTWLHLLPGMILIGIGSGVVNVPLISTAMGVVPPQRAGMASGVNSTFRQVGIATGIAVLGAIFIAQIRSTVVPKLAGTPLHLMQNPRLIVTPQDIAQAAASGRLRATVSQLVPSSSRDAVNKAAELGFVHGLNLILLVSAVLCVVAAVLTFFLIREKDFVSGQGTVRSAALADDAERDHAPDQIDG